MKITAAFVAVALAALRVQALPIVDPAILLTDESRLVSAASGLGRENGASPERGIETDTPHHLNHDSKIQSRLTARDLSELKENFIVKRVNLGWFGKVTKSTNPYEQLPKHDVGSSISHLTEELIEPESTIGSAAAVMKMEDAVAKAVHNGHAKADAIAVEKAIQEDSFFDQFKRPLLSDSSTAKTDALHVKSKPAVSEKAPVADVKAASDAALPEVKDYQFYVRLPGTSRPFAAASKLGPASPFAEIKFLRPMTKKVRIGSQRGVVTPKISNDQSRFGNPKPRDKIEVGSDTSVNSEDPKPNYQPQRPGKAVLIRKQPQPKYTIFPPWLYNQPTLGPTHEFPASNPKRFYKDMMKSRSILKKQHQETSKVHKELMVAGKILHQQFKSADAAVKRAPASARSALEKGRGIFAKAHDKHYHTAKPLKAMLDVQREKLLHMKYFAKSVHVAPRRPPTTATNPTKPATDGASSSSGKSNRGS